MIEYLADASVDETTDLQLRALLCACFSNPGDDVFQRRRYYHEPPAHRWIIRAPDGTLVAHTAVHEKTVEVDGRPFPIGGVAEVCVLPEYRGRGYVRDMLSTAHAWMIEQGMVFSVLFGKVAVYTSSGYREVHNLYMDVADQPDRQVVTAMIHELASTPWPQDEVYLPGPSF